MNTELNQPAADVSAFRFPNSALPVRHPRKTIVSEFPAGGRRTRKYDGCFTPLEIAGCTVLAEYVTAKSGAFLTLDDKQLLAQHGHFYAAFDVVSHDGQSIANHCTSARAVLLNSLLHTAPPHPNLLPRGGEGTGAPVILAETITESAASVIARGGEGVCWQDWSAPYGEMLAIKAASIYVCRVLGRSTGQSVFIADAATGEPRGAVALRGGKCDQVHPGSIIRVEGMGLTEAGKIRQPVLCREWLIS